MYRTHIKRCVDFGLAAFGLLLAAPMFLLVAVLIRVVMGAPVIFRQQRPGRDAQLFPCFKFRTMAQTCDSQGQLLPDRERMVPLGTWLRRTSLDELPQLWNVLRGDLSFIGPRPLLAEYLPFYTAEEQRRHTVRPGLTGWAQVHGRNAINFDERLRMDVWYVDHLTWQLDLRIAVATLRLVFSADGTELVSYLPLHEQRRAKLERGPLAQGPAAEPAHPVHS